MQKVLLFLLFILFVPFQAYAYEPVKDSFYFMKDDGEFSDEEKDEEAMYIFNQCRDNAIQGAYFNCACVAGAYRQERDKPDLIPQSQLHYSIFDDQNHNCADPVAAAGEAYEFCINFAQSFRREHTNNEQYCECVGRRFGLEFAKTGRLSTDYISDLRLESMEQCDYQMNRLSSGAR